jgi:hypothetical protein
MVHQIRSKFFCTRVKYLLVEAGGWQTEVKKYLFRYIVVHC